MKTEKRVVLVREDFKSEAHWKSLMKSIGADEDADEAIFEYVRNSAIKVPTIVL